MTAEERLSFSENNKKEESNKNSNSEVKKEESDKEKDTDKTEEVDKTNDPLDKAKSTMTAEERTTPSENNKKEESNKDKDKTEVIEYQDGDTIKQQPVDGENTRYEFYKGNPIKYIREKMSGNFTRDTSDSNTNKAVAAINQENEREKGILSGITSMPDKLFRFFAGDDYDKNQDDKKEGIFSKILKGAIKVAAFGALLSFAPKIVSFIKPILQDFKDGFLSGWKHTGEQLDTIPEKIGNFFGSHLNDGITFIKDFLSGSGKFEGKGFPYLLDTYILPNALKGFEYLMANVVPKAAEIFVKNFPAIIRGALKGLGGFFNGVFHSNDHVEDETQDIKIDSSKLNVDTGENFNYKVSSAWNTNGLVVQTGNTADTSSISTDSNGVINISSPMSKESTSNESSTNTSTTNDSNTGLKINSNSDLFNKKSDSSNTTTGNSNGNLKINSNSDLFNKNTNTKSEKSNLSINSSSPLFKSNNTIASNNKNNTSTNKKTKSAFDKINNSLPNAFSNIGKVTQKHTMASYEQSKDKTVNVDGYGQMSVQELLNRDDIVVATTQDEQGNTVNITGANILNYPEVANQFGIDSMLTLDEKDDNTKQTLGKTYELNEFNAKKKIKEAAVRSFFTGGAKGASFVKGVGSGLSKTGKIITKIGKVSPIARGLTKFTGRTINAVGKATQTVGKGLGTIGKIGGYVLPTNVVGSTAKDAAKASLEGSKTKKVLDFGAAVAGKVKNKLVKASQESNNKLLKKVAKTITEKLPKVFSDNKIVKTILKFLGREGKEAMQKRLTQGLIRFGERLASKVSSKLLKSGIKLAAKTAAKLGSQVISVGLVTIAFAVYGFIKAWKKADEYFKVSEPTFMMKLISGAVGALNDGFLLGLLPMKTLTQMALNQAEKIEFFKDTVGDIRKQQEELKNEVKEFDAKTNEYNLSPDEYLSLKKQGRLNKDGTIKEKKSLFEKIKDKATSTSSKIVSKAKELSIKKKKKKTNKNKKKTAKAGNTTKKTTYGKKTTNVTSGETSLLSGSNLENIQLNSEDAVNDILSVSNTTNDTDNTTNSDLYDTISYSDSTSGNTDDLTTYQTNAAQSVIANSSDTVLSLIDEMNTASPVIAAEHESLKKKLSKNSLKNYWDLSSKAKATGAGESLANFLAYYEKALLFPIAMANTVVENSSELLYSGATTSNTNSSFSAVSTGSSGSIGGTSSIKSTISKSTSTNRSKSSNTKKKTSAIKKVTNKIKKTASAVWGGIKSFFGAGSGLNDTGNPPTEPSNFGKNIKDMNSIEDVRDLKSNEYFVSQIDSSLSNTRFNTKNDSIRQTISEAGCAPAVATMAINLANRTGYTSNTQTFRKSINDALKYKLPDEGVTADYFINEFSQNGLSTAFISGSDSKAQDSITNMLRNNRPVVLVGTDSSNDSKKNSPFGPNGHYVVATGISDDGRYIYINDPESKTPNTVYDINKVLGTMSLGIAPVPKNTKLDQQTKNSQIQKYMKRYRGMALSGSSNKEKIWKFLVGQGCTPQAAAGIMGNLMQECGTSLDPSTAQFGGGPGRGICQWTINSGRWNGLMSVANSMGVSWDNLEAQCKWMWNEIQSESTWVAKLKSNKMTPQSFIQLTDINKATEIFCTCFERAGVAAMSKRKAYAQQVYDEMKGVSGSSSGTVVAASFPKYNLSDAQVTKYAAAMIKEQPDKAGWMAEASLLANLTDMSGDDKATPENLEKKLKSGWFASVTVDAFNSPGSPPKDAKDAVKQVLVDGKRTLPRYVDEHDCFKDITSAVNNGTSFDPFDRSKYQKNVTKLANKYGSSGTFYSFPSSEPKSDPFYYTSEANRTKYGDGYYDESGNAVGDVSAGESTASSDGDGSWKNPKIITDLFGVFDKLAAAYGLTTLDSSSDGVSSSDTGDGTVTGGATVSDAEKAKLQQRLANSFIKSENNLKTYSQSARYNFTVGDDDIITGTSADCSSTVEKVYEKIIGIDPGSWTGAQATNSNTYTVDQGTGSPGSAATASKLQLGDMVIYGPEGSKHVEMYVGDGKTMGMGSEPGPHYSKSTLQDGKIIDSHSQGQGFYVARRWNGFKEDSSSSSTSTTHTTTDLTTSGSGSGLLSKMNKSRKSSKNTNPIKNIFKGKGSGLSTKVDKILSNSQSYDKSTSNVSLYNDNTSDYNIKPVYSYSKNTDSDVYVNNVNQSSNSTELVSMLKAIVKILVKIVNNSENMKQVVSLLTQLVTVVSTNNNSMTGEEKKATASSIKMNLLNTINSATSSNPDKELIDIINNMEALASD